MLNYHQIWLRRCLVALGLVVAFLMTQVIPLHMKENSDWSLQYAVQNFANGRLTLDNTTFSLQESEVSAANASLNQYEQIGNQQWVYTGAPGYIFFLLPFYYMHASALGNLLLLIGMTVVGYLLLKRIFNERAACLGVLLWIFSPITLAMLQRSFADTFAAASFVGMGGGLYIYYCLRRGELSRRVTYAVLFLAGLGLGLGVCASYANAWVVAVFIIHFIYLQVRQYTNRLMGEIPRSVVCFAIGLLLPLCGLLLYQNAVFGAPFRFGFQYTQLPVAFSWRFVPANIERTVVAWLIALPLLIPGLAALVWALYKRSFQNVFSGDMLVLLASWVLSVFGLYLSYEWTAVSDMAGMPFIMSARYVLPGLFPLLLLSTLWLGQLSRRALWGVVFSLLIAGVVFFAQSALAYPEVPHNPINPWLGAQHERSTNITGGVAGV